MLMASSKAVVRQNQPRRSGGGGRNGAALPVGATVLEYDQPPLLARTNSGELGASLKTNSQNVLEGTGGLLRLPSWVASRHIEREAKRPIPMTSRCGSLLLSAFC